MGDAMPDQRMHARIGEQGFQFAAGGGVAQTHATDILLDQPQQRRKTRLDVRQRFADTHINGIGHGRPHAQLGSLGSQTSRQIRETVSRATGPLLRTA